MVSLLDEIIVFIITILLPFLLVMMPKDFLLVVVFCAVLPNLEIRSCLLQICCVLYQT